jgi:hypothetical protein
MKRGDIVYKQLIDNSDRHSGWAWVVKEPDENDQVVIRKMHYDYPFNKITEMCVHKKLLVELSPEELQKYPLRCNIPMYSRTSNPTVLATLIKDRDDYIEKDK